MNSTSRRSSVRRSETFQLQKSASLMEKEIPRRSVSIEFPTSPDESLFGEEMQHFTHSHHTIALVNLPDLFICSGCKENGAGKRFSCQECDFQLHDFCALSPPLLKAHPLHAQHQLVFHSKPKTGGIRWPKCNICGKSTKGFNFRCSYCHFQMHPCCAMLSDQINFPSLHPHPLKLLPPLNLTLTADDNPAGLLCGDCKRKRSGRLYGCTVCNHYHLHAVCAKDFINGLKANGIKTNEKPPSFLGPAVKLASQVVIEFISGLVEGIGEGMGDVLIQNIARGDRRSRHITR